MFHTLLSVQVSTPPSKILDVVGSTFVFILLLEEVLTAFFLFSWVESTASIEGPGAKEDKVSNTLATAGLISCLSLAFFKTRKIITEKGKTQRSKSEEATAER